MALTPNCTRQATPVVSRRIDFLSATGDNNRHFSVVPGYNHRHRREFRYLGEREGIESRSHGGKFKRAVLTNTCLETANDGSGKLHFRRRQTSIRQAGNLASESRKLMGRGDVDYDVRDVGISNGEALRYIFGSDMDGCYRVANRHSRQFDSVAGRMQPCRKR